jgi:signal transduction histidine kinase
MGGTAGDDLAMNVTNESVAPSGAARSVESKLRDAAILHWMEELAPIGIFTTDNELRIKTWNYWLETHSARPASTVLGKPLFEVFPDLVTRQFDAYFHQAVEGQVNVLSTALHGYLLPFAATERDSGFEHMQQTARIGPLLLNETVCGTITTIEDVTQREMQARQVRQHAENLESKVRERTKRLNETIAQLESFSYTVAHDLRAPIRALEGYAVVLLEDYGAEIPEKGLRFLERIKRAAEGMDLLTRDLLEFSRISRQQIDPEPVEPAVLVEEIVQHTPALQVPGVLITHTPMHAVLGNRTMLRQCLANLIDNALKFVAPDRPPRIALWTERYYADNEPGSQSASSPPFIAATTEGSRQTAGGVSSERMTATGQEAGRNDRIRIFIEDNGIGITSENHQKIFGIFERIPGSGNYEGTGIGLAIVARAVERMNGSCGVESNQDVGSRFWIELPAT